jgi:hypothetical protein
MWLAGSQPAEDKKRTMIMMVFTKYLGPTDHKPARVKAWTSSKSLTVQWNWELGSYANHANVARSLMIQMGFSKLSKIVSHYNDIKNPSEGWIFIADAHPVDMNEAFEPPKPEDYPY